MQVEDYGPLLRSGGVLLHSVATAQSTMDYSVMAVDEGVVDSPITQAPIPYGLLQKYLIESLCNSCSTIGRVILYIILMNI